MEDLHLWFKRKCCANSDQLLDLRMHIFVLFVYIYIYIYIYICYMKKLYIYLYLYICIYVLSSVVVEPSTFFGEPPQVTQKPMLVSSPLPLRLSWAGQNPKVRPATTRMRLHPPKLRTFLGHYARVKNERVQWKVQRMESVSLYNYIII